MDVKPGHGDPVGASESRLFSMRNDRKIGVLENMEK
jgi:hypothetical protein